jgi:hypothetical protein
MLPLMTVTAPGSANAPGVSGSVLPRLWTPPLIIGEPGPCGCGCALTDDTSAGFAVAEWARDVLHYPLDAWQRWAVIHGLELLPDGRPRFRTLLVEVGRQNGKTTLLTVLSLWWQFVVEVGLILGTSTKLDYAKESWHAAVRLAESAPALTRQRAARWRRDTNGEQESWTLAGSRYKIAASNPEGGRSLPVERLILDELRQHHDYSAWLASVNAGNAQRNFQVWAITNAGTDRSVVLNDLHDACEVFLAWVNEVGASNVAAAAAAAPGDWRTGMFSWSCADSANPLDPAELARANPNLNNPRSGEPSTETLLGAARIAVAAGGEALAGFRTEVMCIRVRAMNLAIDLGAWARCADAGSLDAFRDRVAACLDVSPDGQRADLVVAVVLPDGRTRVEAVKSWDGLAAVRAELPAWLGRVRPYTFGWFPGSGAAALAADLSTPKSGRVGWPPRGVRSIAEIKADAPAVCMGFAALVGEQAIAHSEQDALTAQIGNAEKRARGADGLWVFDRIPGSGYVTAVYAAAGAVHLARTMPPPVRRAGLHIAGV